MVNGEKLPEDIELLSRIHSLEQAQRLNKMEMLLET